VADAASLADDQVGRGQCTIDPVQTFFKAAVVVQKASAMLLDDAAVGFDRSRPPADTQDIFAIQPFMTGQLGNSAVRACGFFIHLGIGQSRVSDLVRGKWEKFSLDMLVTLATRAGRKVAVAIA
jgi:hypothetical protein